MAGDNLQIFNLETKAKLKSVQFPQSVVHWKWVSPTRLGLVTATEVFHWELEVGGWGDREREKGAGQGARREGRAVAVARARARAGRMLSGWQPRGRRGSSDVPWRARVQAGTAAAGAGSLASLKHLPFQGASDPVKVFDRAANLENTQIISYRVDPSDKW